MIDRKTREALEACRPGHEDLNEPEMQSLRERLDDDPHSRAVFGRSQTFDANVGRAFHDVPVPETLQDRLLTAVTQASAESSETLPDEMPEKVELPQTLPELTPHSASRWSRWQRLATGLTAAAAVLAAALLLNHFLLKSVEPQPNGAFRTEVVAWLEAVAEGPWEADFRAEQLQAHPMDGAIRALPSGWRPFATKYDAHCVVYNLSGRSATPALLFCMQCPSAQSSMSSLPQRTPFSTTGGVAIGMWRRGDLVYVLAVQGGGRQYRSLLERTIEIGLRLSLSAQLS